MDESGQSALEARNEAFRRLGRNLYLIQLIEHQLKHLVVHVAVDGHAGNLAERIATKSKRARKASMGTLTSQFTSIVFSDKEPDRAEPRDPTRAWYSFRFRIAADEQLVQQRKRELRQLVRERNRLIHTVAADIRPDDTDKWIGLGVFLDEQRAKLVAEHENLRLLIKDLAEMAQQSAQAIELELLGAAPKSSESAN